MINVYDCKLIEIPRIQGIEHSFTVANSNLNLPFDIARVYYLYNIPDGKERGGHAHKKLQQLIISIVGSFTLSLDDGTEKRRIRLSRSNCGLFIPGHIWTRVQDIAQGSVCMVLASLPYDENEYLRDYDQFLNFKHTQRGPVRPRTRSTLSAAIGGNGR